MGMAPRCLTALLTVLLLFLLVLLAVVLAVGAARRSPVEGGATKSRHWTKFETWHELKANKSAWASYLHDREQALKNLNFDWSAVMEEIKPKLQENREYFGIINRASEESSWEREGNPHPLKIAEIEPSPVAGLTHVAETDTSYASVPADFVARMSSKPALFMFHTHIDCKNAVQLPSSTDVLLSISLALKNMYAGSVVLSRYGATLYTPSERALSDIRTAKNPALAASHYRHDVGHCIEGIRSWGNWKLDDVKKLYQRFKLQYVIYPSPTYTADSEILHYYSAQDRPAAEDVLHGVRREIEAARSQ